jgi:CHASE3 domain sensor protein
MEPERRSNNPLRSEDAAFRWLIRVAVVVGVLIVLVLAARAIF